MNVRKATRRNLIEIFAVPFLIAVLSSVGLISALVGNGWWDAASWTALGIPPLLYVIFICRRKPS